MSYPSRINIHERFEKLIRSDAEALEAHLEYVVKDFPIAETKTTFHGHFIIVDTNNHNRVDRLIEAMRARVADYAIPRSQLREAQEKDLNSGTTKNVALLYEQAKNLFTDIATTGEGGELLLYMLAENYLGLPQVLCKMSLKTDSRDHFKGSDGVYMKYDTDANLLLYWGESKIYGDIQSSIRECLKSLSPFLLQPENEDAERENDLYLLNSGAINLNDSSLLIALKNYLDKHNRQNRKLKYCGIALAGFSHDGYTGLETEDKIEEMKAIVQSEINDWVERVKGRLDAEKLHQFEIHFFALAMPDAQKFRDAFRGQMGLKEENES